MKSTDAKATAEEGNLDSRVRMMAEDTRASQICPGTPNL